MAPNEFTQQGETASLEASIRRLGPSMARVASETAGAFFASNTVLGSDLSVIPRLPDLGVLRCSQKNIGEKYEMICNLSVEKSEWDRFFTAGESDDFRLDAFCEMANCICGGLLAEAAFTDEFGFLIPCVPYTGHAKATAGSRGYRSAFRMGGAWIYFTIKVHTATGILSPSMMVA